MAQKKIFAACMSLLISAVFMSHIHGICLGQSADNTKVNTRDKSRKELTADQQGQSRQDREISQKIRQAIRSDKSLSTYAQNVKIITIDGTVTLKGPVKSENEKRVIEAKAAQIAGNTKVKSEMDIAPKKTRK